MRKFLSLILILTLTTAIAMAQHSLTYNTTSKARSLIDIPTAGALDRGEYDFDTRIFANGGILMGFSVGLFDRFNMGILYGGTEVISDSPNIKWNENPGVEVKYRLVQENVYIPALSLGYSNQGFGPYSTDNDTTDSDDAKRYQIKSPGLYVVGSKNFKIMGHKDMGFHLGANLNTSEREDDDGVNFFTGVDVSINEQIALILEYNLALDDDSDQAYGEGKGYLNGGIRWSFAQNLLFQFNFKDLTSNNKYTSSINREVKIVYYQNI